jgi:hypothetical protein
MAEVSWWGGTQWLRAADYFVYGRIVLEKLALKNSGSGWNTLMTAQMAYHILSNTPRFICCH